jgi:ketosteroid isomerase-like protein
MSEHPNIGVLRRGYEAFADGDMATVRSVWTDDITWHVTSSGKLRGDYHGPEEVFGFLARLDEETGGTNQVDVHAILADDEHGAVLINAHAERNGKSATQPAVHVYHFRDGKAAEAWFAVTDPEQVVELWR